MTDDLLLLDEHRLPDGSRPLVIGKPHPSLQPQLLEPTEQPLTCFTVRFAAGVGEEPHRTCRRVIQPGEHYLLFVERDRHVNLRPTRTYAYCAPCAVRECPWWDITEAAS